MGNQLGGGVIPIFQCLYMFVLADFRAHMHFRRSNVEVLDWCFFRRINITSARIDNAGFPVIRLCKLGVIIYRRRY